jgi:hypothetical protein
LTLPLARNLVMACSPTDSVYTISQVTNMATTSFTRVGNSADSRMLAESRDSVYGNASRRASAAAESGSDAGADAVSHCLQTLVGR